MQVKCGSVKMPSTAETESGSSPSHWPTPRATDFKGAGLGTNDQSIQKRLDNGTNNLSETVQAVQRGMWPTPTAVEWKGRGPNSKQQGLAEQAKMWPTPRSSEHKDCGPVGSKSHTHMLDRKYLCAATKESDRPTGKLNPQWVEWLMGYPIGWTDLKD